MDESPSVSESGITRRFQSFHAALPAKVEQDEYGFVVPSPSLLGIEEVLRAPAVLIRGRPWMGKTYLSKAIRNQQLRLSLGEYVWHSPLEIHTQGRPVEPEAWNEWRASQANACWIIDSLDEGELVHTNVSTLILDLLATLDDAARQRLRLVVLGRETEIPQSFVDSLRDLYGTGVHDVVLMPLDRDNASRIVGERDFDAVLSVIRDRRLESVCSIPAALKYIAKHKDAQELSEESIWKGVLCSLLEEKSTAQARKRLSRCQVDQLFGAAARIAVVLTFSDYDRLDDAPSMTSALDVGQLCKSDSRHGEPTVVAAREAIRTAMFSRGKFAQKNIQEWMCAFGLKEFSLGRVKSLLTGVDSSLSRHHWTVLSLLAKIGRPEVRDWLQTANGGMPPLCDLTALTLGQVEDILCRLEAIAERSPWELSLWGHDSLRRLRVRGIGEVLAERLSDSSRSAGRRSLLIQIALETESREPLSVAKAIVEDAKEDESLRYSALVLMYRLCTPQEFGELAPFVKRAQPGTVGEKKIVSTIIKRYVEDDLWTLTEAVEYAPEPDGDVIDSTAVLAHYLTERMTVAAARDYISRWLGQHNPPCTTDRPIRRRSERRRNELLIRAIECLLTQEPPNESDLRLLVPLADLRHSEEHEFLGQIHFAAAFAKCTALRRELYVREMEATDHKGARAYRRELRWLMQADDIEWFIPRLPKLGETDEQVWNDFLIIAFSRATPPSLRRRAKRFVDSRCPERLVEFRRNRRESLRAQRKWQEETAVREPRKRLGIQQVVEKLLTTDKIGLQQKMWQLSWICFGNDQERPHNIDGKWTDLPPSVQSQVLSLCERALATCEPTPIPDGSSFPGSILYEAWCFRKLVNDRRPSFALDTTLIGKWLPSMFIVSLENTDATLAACSDADSRATEQVLIDAIEREVRNGSEHMIGADNISADYWTEGLVKAVIEIIGNPNANELSRAALLPILSRHATNDAVRVAREVVAKRPCNPLWYAALSVLVPCDLQTAWPLFTSAVADHGKDALIQVPSLYQRRRAAMMTDTSGWSADRLLSLFRMLSQAFPYQEGSELHSGWITPESELRELRANIPCILFTRGPGCDRTALERLVNEYGYLGNWFAHAKAEEAAHGEIGRISPPATEEGGMTASLPLDSILALLDNADYRVVRHNDDLVDVVEELLRRIGGDVANHIELMYHMDKQGKRQPQNESAVQAYVHCRLSDMLPGRVLDDGTKVSIHREPQGRLRQRTDVEIVAPLVSGGLGVLVIEVKWSHNRDVSSSLMEQLGTEYLLKSKRTHGIYLVGWSGELKWDRSRPRGAVMTAAKLREMLSSQAKTFCREHPSTVIRPIVFDLEWRQSAGITASRRTRSHRTKNWPKNFP